MVIYLVSLTQKCFCTGNGHCGDSIAVALTGWLGIASYPFAIPWLANPFLFASWYFVGNPKLSLSYALIAFLLSVSFLLVKEIITDGSGIWRKITGYKAGYWLWVLSCFVFLVGHLIHMFVGN